MTWQLTHTGLDRCSSMRARMGRLSSGFNGGTFGKGGGGATPKNSVSICLPRLTGDVRSLNELTVRKLPCPRIPARALSVYVNFRNSLARYAGNSVMTGEPFVEKCVVGGPQIQGVMVVVDLTLEEQPRLGCEILAQSFVCALRFISESPKAQRSRKSVTRLFALASCNIRRTSASSPVGFLRAPFLAASRRAASGLAFQMNFAIRAANSASDTRFVAVQRRIHRISPIQSGFGGGDRRLV